MNKTIIKILETNIKGQLAGADLGGGICIAGSPGIGKTQNMYAIADRLNMHLIQVSIPEVSTEELSGIPDFVSSPAMDKYSITSSTGSLATRWSVPQIIEVVNRLAVDDTKNGCILFIDDLHRVNMAVAPYLYGLLGERKLGSFTLDKRVAIMGAMNDSEEAGFSGIDSPIKDRLGILPVKFDFDYWFKNFGRGLHFYISSFLQSHATYAQEDESTMIEQFGTPRSWTHLANEFELYDREFIQQHTVLLASQKVSKAASQELAKHITYIEAIDFSKKVKSREQIQISKLKPIEQILYAYIVNYIITVDDAKYLIELIDDNMASSNFIGFIVGELYTKFLSKDKGKPIPTGVAAVIDCLLKTPFNASNYPGTSKKDLTTIEEFKFRDHAALFELASEFIN